MQRIFVLLCFAGLLTACECENKETAQTEHLSNDGYIESEQFISNFIAKHGDYDIKAVTRLLIGKLWKIEEYYEYSTDWEEMIFNAEIDGLDGYFSLRYIFESDGVLKDFSKYDTHENDPYLLRYWTFDPETRTLTIDGALNYHLIALGEDTFVWDYTSSSSGYTRYYREVFKAKSLE